VARRQAQGNPLAAGLIAFGAGWLVSSLLPASRREQQLAEQARDKATELGQPLAEAAKQAATEVKNNLQEPARQAVETLLTCWMWVRPLGLQPIACRGRRSVGSDASCRLRAGSPIACRWPSPARGVAQQRRDQTGSQVAHRGAPQVSVTGSSP
jgi:hypothetical protein